MMRTSISIAEITSLAGRARAFVEIEFISIYDQEMVFSTSALVLTKVTGSLPSMPVLPASKWKHLAGLKLADPKFNIREQWIYYSGQTCPGS
jgi:hypothetical protein